MSDRTGYRVKDSKHKGHDIRIVQREDADELWIDGSPRKFFETDDGFTLHDNAYAQPGKTLLDAAKEYLDGQPESDPEGD